MPLGWSRMNADEVPGAQRLRDVNTGSAPSSALGSVGGFAVAERGGLRSLSVVTGIATEIDFDYGLGYIRPGTFREGKLWGVRWGDGLQRALDRLRAQSVSVGGRFCGRRDPAGRARPLPPRYALADHVRIDRQRDARRSSQRCGQPSPEQSLHRGARASRPVRVSARGSVRCGGEIFGEHDAPLGAHREPSPAPARNAHCSMASPRAQVLPDVSDTISSARHAIIGQLAAQARRLHADGIINASVDLPAPGTELSALRTRYSLTATAIATAITQERPDALTPRMTLRLNDSLALRPSPSTRSEQCRKSRNAAQRRHL